MPQASGWPEELRKAGDRAAERFAELLVSALRPSWQPDPLVVAACAELEADPHDRISSVARRLGVSHGRLLVHFRSACGVTPKVYADLVRFHRFVTALQSADPVPTWSQLATDHGYYDQPHFIGCFRRYVGCTPTEYLATLREHGTDYALFVPMTQA